MSDLQLDGWPIGVTEEQKEEAFQVASALLEKHSGKLLSDWDWYTLINAKLRQPFKTGLIREGELFADRALRRFGRKVWVYSPGNSLGG